MSEPQTGASIAGADASGEEKSRPVGFGPRAALVFFVVLEVIAAPLMVSWGHSVSFGVDDWDFLAARKLGDLGDLMRPHFGHWTTIPIVAYRITWSLFGMRSYTPYLMLVVGAHLAVAGLLRAVMRRAGVGPWLATLAAGLLLFFGSGAENVLVAFQITFVWALAFGLGQLLLADHAGPLDRRDGFALLCGVAAVLCSGLGITMVAVVGMSALLRRGWRIAAFHTVPLASLFLIWFLAAPKGQSTTIYKATSPWAVTKFTVVGVAAAFGRLGRLPGVGVLLALLLVVGLALTCWTRDRDQRKPIAAPIALAIGSIVFLVTTGLTRSGAAGVLAQTTAAGTSRARLSRYEYIVAALALPAIALAADTAIRRWPRLAIGVIAVLAIGLPGNIAQFSAYAKTRAHNRVVLRSLLAAAHNPLATQLPRATRPEPFFARDVTVGWLLDSRRSGRVPSAEHLTANEAATETLYLVLQPTTAVHEASCRDLPTPIAITLGKGDSIADKVGVINIINRPIGGGRSAPRRLSPSKAAVALAGPLHLELVPLHDAGDRTVVCSTVEK